MSPSSRVSIVWSNLHNQCDVKGFCGLNSYCAVLEKTNKTECRCYPGFVINPVDMFPGCYQNASDDGCTGNEDPRLGYKVASVDNISWPIDHPYSVVPLKNPQVCSDSCLEDCSCKAALYTNGNCNKYKLPLRYGIRSPDTTGFIKVDATHNHNPMATGNSTSSPVSSYTCTDFRELENATHCFKEELGRGTFGAVYKGTLSTSNKIVAVKRLEKVVEEGAGKLYKLVEDDEQNVDLKTLERMVKVGLWCVQDDPALRPLMKNVILMLEGTTDIPVPPSPELRQAC
ncbi:hypothetical protein GBA52_020300 [Prunus armeniaca]|nr:hypothetical protein GBA52_020300 [Prunus armeniaca]